MDVAQTCAFARSRHGGFTWHRIRVTGPPTRHTRPDGLLDAVPSPSKALVDVLKDYRLVFTIVAAAYGGLCLVLWLAPGTPEPVRQFLAHYVVLVALAVVVLWVPSAIRRR